MFRNRITLALSLAMLFHAPLSQAQEAQSGKRRGPPPQALEACAGKAAGAACSFTGRNGEPRNGTCFQPPARPAPEGATAAPGAAASLPLACRPERPGPAGQQAPRT